MLDLKQAHKLLMADRTRDAVWISAAIEHVLTADPTVTLAEVESAFREAGGSTYVIARRDMSSGFVIAIGMPAWRSALDRAGLTAQANRDTLAAR